MNANVVSGNAFHTAIFMVENLHRNSYTGSSLNNFIASPTFPKLIIIIAVYFLYSAKFHHHVVLAVKRLS